MTGDGAVPVRLSHLLRHCSVGAVVRGPEYLVTVKDTSFWRCGIDQEIRHVDQVRSALGIGKALRSPPKARVEDSGEVRGQTIPAMRFPGWMRCSRCGLLYRQPWRQAKRSGSKSHSERAVEEAVCIRKDDLAGAACGGKLEQAPWVLAHECGYLADVPWHALAHANAGRPEQRQCLADWTSPYLRVVAVDRGYRVECTRKRCGAYGSLPHRFPFSDRGWQQPWFSEPPRTPPDELAWVLEINDVRVHSPETSTALVIPPESRIRRGTVVDRLYGSREKQAVIRDARPGLQRTATLRRIANEFGCTQDDVERALVEIDQGYPLYGKSISRGDLLQSEYRALIEKIPDLREDEEFVTEHHTDAWSILAGELRGAARILAGAVDRLVAVNRLKEIMVFEGFRRLGGDIVVPPDLTGESDWLPALELYGEGIFFTVRESLLRHWEIDDQLGARAREFLDRFVRTTMRLPMKPQQISPRFLLLHTLAHLMIRRLEMEAGYPAASLKERIYSHADGESEQSPMAGILIYVAVPDTEGSLGGLMRQAEPDRFLRLLTAVVEAAAWCSLDPVCREQEGHGPDLLNRAACHACALVPEPSCAFGNVLLDRTFVTGDATRNIRGPFRAVRLQAGADE